jgi:hypothetical protein
LGLEEQKGRLLLRLRLRKEEELFWKTPLVRTRYWKQLFLVHPWLVGVLQLLPAVLGA